MTKNKKQIYISFSIIGIIVIIILLNWGNIKFMFDMFSSYKKYEQVNDTPENNEKNFDEPNPILKSMEKNLTINIKNEDNNNENSESIEINDNNKNSIENNNNEVYVSIVSKYNDQFTSLQEEYEGALNSMIKQGYSEYKSGNISKSKLISKYLSKGKALEKESDGKVNALIKQMEDELKKNGFDPSVAKEVKKYYNGYKENRRGEVMAKAMNAVDIK